jgi:protein TonB
VQTSIKIPQQLAGFVSGPVTIKFAVNRDGSVGRFELVTPVPDPRIGDAIWRGVQSCKFTPAADPQGRPTAMWVIIPIRFAGG